MCNRLYKCVVVVSFSKKKYCKIQLMAEVNKQGSEAGSQKQLARNMNSQVTIHDIAKALGITASTVSRALANNLRISEATRKEVQEMAKKMNYQRNTVASNLRMGKGNTLGIIVPRINRFFFSNVISGIENIAHENKFNTIICQSYEQYEKEVESVKALLDARVDGIIISLSANTTQYTHIKEVMNRRVPLIMFDRVEEDLDVSKVIVDDYAGAFRATEHLIELGCRRIAHIAGPMHINVYKNRYLGYSDAMKKYNLAYLEDLVKYGMLTKEDGMKCMKEFLKMKPHPDAVFAASDYSALGAVLECKKQSVKIPEEVAIVGFANESFTEYMDPPLTSVDQRSNEMGHYVARMFFEEIKLHDKDLVPRKTILDPELIVRESTMRKNQRQ